MHKNCAWLTRELSWKRLSLGLIHFGQICSSKDVAGCQVELIYGAIGKLTSGGLCSSSSRVSSRSSGKEQSVPCANSKVYMSLKK